MVDPIQWFIMLTGQNIESREHPSVVLLVCMFKTIEMC